MKPMTDPGEEVLTEEAMERHIKEISERMLTNLLKVLQELAEAAYFVRMNVQALAGVRIKHARLILENIASWEESKEKSHE